MCAYKLYFLGTFLCLFIMYCFMYYESLCLRLQKCEHMVYLAGSEYIYIFVCVYIYCWRCTLTTLYTHLYLSDTRLAAVQTRWAELRMTTLNSTLQAPGECWCVLADLVSTPVQFAIQSDALLMLHWRLCAASKQSNTRTNGIINIFHMTESKQKRFAANTKSCEKMKIKFTVVSTTSENQLMVAEPQTWHLHTI